VKECVTIWVSSEQRYDEMIYRRCGRSGLMLPAVSLGLYHNFGGVYFSGTNLLSLRSRTIVPSVSSGVGDFRSQPPFGHPRPLQAIGFAGLSPTNRCQILGSTDFMADVRSRLTPNALLAIARVLQSR